MSGIVDFLNARYDEDEQLAQAVDDNSPPWPGQWKADGENVLRTFNDWVLIWPGHEGRDLAPGLIAHIAHYDPARVLADIEAKRRIISDYESAAYTLSVAGTGTPPHDIMTGAVNTLKRMLYYLALPYAHHPDFDPDWQP